MKKQIWIVVILAIIIIVLTVLLVLPTKPKSNNQTDNQVSNQVNVVEGIQVIYPKANDEVSSLLKISGVVTGNGWAGFEGQVGTVKLLDNNGNQLASGVLTATTEWTSLPTVFETKLNFTSASGQSGSLVFKNENPSGDPTKDKTFTLPINFK